VLNVSGVFKKGNRRSIIWKIGTGRRKGGRGAKKESESHARHSLRPPCVCVCERKMGNREAVDALLKKERKKGREEDRES